jgi:hypothetical protein
VAGQRDRHAHLFRSLRQKPVRVARAAIVEADGTRVPAPQVKQHAIL